MNRYCIWLTFDSEDLRDIIFELSRRFNSPNFQPHITLLGTTDAHLIKLKSAIYNFVDDLDLENITSKKVNYTDEYFKSYFIEIKEKQSLTNWHKRICELLNVENDEQYLPHISLMYNKLSKNEKSEIELPFQIGKSFKIRSIQITECDEKIENWKPVFELTIGD